MPPLDMATLLADRACAYLLEDQAFFMSWLGYAVHDSQLLALQSYSGS